MWEPLLAKFGEGRLLKELSEGNCLSNPHVQVLHAMRCMHGCVCSRPVNAHHAYTTHNTHTHTQPAKGAKQAYLAATAGKCKGCGAATPLLNLLTVEMTCWPCFDEWRKANLIGKSKVGVCACIFGLVGV